MRVVRSESEGVAETATTLMVRVREDNRVVDVNVERGYIDKKPNRE